MAVVLNIETSPHTHSGKNVPAIMRQVVLALVPSVLASVYFFGLRALLLVSVCVGVCLVAEHVCQRLRQRPTSVGDGSALITGILLALMLPPSLPLWAASVGAVVAIVMGKMVFGGLGQNKFNPALVGRAFLQAAFPVLMTTWSSPSQKITTLDVDMITQATPLAAMKFHHILTDYAPLFWGNVSGSLGETSALAILIGGVYLIFRGIADWRAVAGVIGGAVALNGLFWLINPELYVNPLFHILSGGFMLGTFFMATDMVASPTTPKGRWLYGLGIGALIILIRTFSGLPEGVMYAILLMNAVSPLIERHSQPRLFGSVPGSSNRADP